jgi:hypothetical protein
MIGRDNRLAWLLADELTVSFGHDDHTAVYVELGAGEIWPAITRMLTIAVRDELSLPAGLVTEFTVWLDKYVGGIEEPLIRDLLARVPSRRGDSTAVSNPPGAS